MKTPAHSTPWYLSSDISWSKACAIAIAVFGVLSAIQISPVGERIHTRIAHPIDFWARQKLGKSPVLDPRLQIFTIDYKTIAETDGRGLSTEDWAAVLRGMKNAGASAIFLDQAFGFPWSRGKNGDSLAKAALAELPISVGAAITPSAIEGRTPVSLSRPEFSLSSRMGTGEPWQHIPWLQVQAGFVQGPAPSFAASIERLGHVNYANNGYFRPLVHVREGVAVPALALLTAREIRIRDKKLVVDNQVVPIDSGGRVLTNLVAPEHYHSRAFSLLGVLRRAKDGIPLLSIRQGDVVLILSQSHSQAEEKETPLGTLPGSVMNTM